MEYKKLNNILGWLVWAIASVTYLLTIEPTASFWDCGEFIATAYRLEVGHPPGAPLFMLLGKFFTMFTSAENAAVAINVMSALSSSFTILFLFWTITAMVKKLAMKTGELTQSKTYAIMGSALVGSLAYTFSDSFWFSAVEGEVYAMSSLFTAVVFWAILKWDAVSGEKHSTRWMVLIAYLMGLSIGVHLLNLLAIPAMVFLFYFKTRDLNVKSFFIATGYSLLILGVVQFGIIPGTYKLGSMFEILFVNSFGMPFNSGLFVYIILLIGLVAYGLYITQKKQKVVWNTILLCFTVILIGYSTFAVIMLRSAANPPMDENNPENAFSLLSYLNREQYGSAPFLTGQFFNTPLDPREPYKEGKPVYFQNKETGKYEQTNKGEKDQPNYDSKTSGFLPRMWSSQGHHVDAYKQWSNFRGKNVRASNGETIKIPTLGENLAFLFNYQWGHLYWRYFMWNFVGRQNDVQSQGEITNGNWLSGIDALDSMRLGDQSKVPSNTLNNPGRNTYFFLPLIFGLIGLVYQFRKDPKDFLVLGLLFFFTGMAINFYTNPPPLQPRERDYAYVGSFYVFTIWMAVGIYALYEILSKKAPQTISAIGVTIFGLFAAPVLMGTQNWDDHDRSGRYTARDFAKNYLNSCAPNSILFTNGDNDTFPLWYVQEVEGYRTDVRVVNLSLLNTDWYIEQMRRKAWDADGIPQRIPDYKIRQGTNDFVPIYDRGIEGHVDVDEAIDFLIDDTPKSKVTVSSGKSVDYFPSKNFSIAVDKQKVMSNGTVPKDKIDRIVDKVEWTINKNYIMKNDLIILDILAANDWERPVYFAITTGADSYIGLTPYFQLEGLAYRLVPYKAMSFDGQTGEVANEIMTENLMNKFVWGGMENPNSEIYLDENNRRMCMNFRNNFSRLAEDYIRLGKNEEAVKTLDYCLSVMPERLVGYNFFMIPVAESYYKLKEYEKGNGVVRSLVNMYHEELKYYLTLRGDDRKSIQGEIDRAKYILQQLIMLTNDKYKECGLADEMAEKFIEINSLILTQG
ncbi:MAG: DUF2723 domain-containing protein [Flavobacteriales bacterium]|nr:DUF2723 domain-containing protein [Flavobacteriales bacterium]